MQKTVIILVAHCVIKIVTKKIKSVWLDSILKGDFSWEGGVTLLQNSYINLLRPYAKLHLKEKYIGPAVSEIFRYTKRDRHTKIRLLLHKDKRIYYVLYSEYTKKIYKNILKMISNINI